MRTLVILLSVSPLFAQTKPPAYPKATLRNAHLAAMTVYIPDAKDGFYRGGRFDWSGVIEGVQFNTHTLFKPWKKEHNPTNHDDITGPAEEFRTPLGFDDAKVGGTFLKVGVGLLVKPDDKPYSFARQYEIKYPGTWEVQQGGDEITFKQGLLTNDGHGYKYTKTIKLHDTLSGFQISHTLENVGTKTLATDWYNHNFFNVDEDPVGVNYTLSFPFDVTPAEPAERFAELVKSEGKTLKFTGALDKGTVHARLDGHGKEAEDHAFHIYHTPSRVNLQMTADVPMEKLMLWGIGGAICPEPYVDLSIKPGQTKTWTLTYVITNGPRRGFR